MTLLQGRMLLQGKRVDLAESGEVARGLGQALLLLGAHVGTARVACAADRCLSSVLVRGGVGVRDGGSISVLDELGNKHVRSVLLHEGVQLQAELVHGALRQALQTHALLGPGHLLAVGGIGEAAQLLGQLVDLLANLVGGGQSLGALGLDGRTLIGRLLHTDARRLGGGARLVPHVRGDRQLGAAPLLGPLGRGALVAFTACGRPQRVGAPAAGALTLLCGAQGEPGVGLDGAGPARGVRSGLALLAGDFQSALEAVGTLLPRGARCSRPTDRAGAVTVLGVARPVLHLGQRGSGGGELGGALDRLGLGALQHPAGTPGLLGGGVGGGGQAGHRLGSPGGLGVGLTQGGQRLAERLASSVLLATGLLQGRVGLSLGLCGGSGLSVGLLVGGGELEDRGGPSTGPGDPAGCQDVTAAGGHDGVGQLAAQGAGGLEVLHYPGVLEQPVQDLFEAPRLRGTDEAASRQCSINGSRLRLVIGAGGTQ